MPRFTAETARAAALLSHAANSARFRPAIPPDPPAPAPQPAPDEYSAKVLARTRNQLDLVANNILHELTKSNPDSRRLRDLSDAQRHLAEQERILAGRPLPGSRRPKDHEPRSLQHGAWMVAEPMVAPAPVVQPAMPNAQPDALPGGVTP